MDPFSELEKLTEKGEGGTNFIPCLKWVQRGVAKADPEKVQLSEEELAAIIKQTQSQLEDLEVGEDDSDAENGGTEEPKEESYDVIKKYGLDKYDEDEEEVKNGLSLGSLVSFANAESDPYLAGRDEDDESDVEDFKIKPTDNLLLAGHVEGNASILEVYVYNDVEDAFYIHHDIILPSFPLALEWINYDPGEKLRASLIYNNVGNFVAIGTMDPEIAIWDLDLVDGLEPAFTLGKKGKKKKTKAKVEGYGHTDAVLSLAWNKTAEHVLASGSVDQTVILWDLNEGKIASTLKAHKEKIQAMQWHPMEAQTLLTGCCDEFVRTFDCRSKKSFKQWKVQGEVEKVIWNHFDPFKFLVGTDRGIVHLFDVRNDEKAVWTLNAHFEGINGMSLSTQCPGCLTTGSSDKTVKVWDILSDQPTCVLDKKMTIGLVHCLEGCPDAPFVVACGGDNPCENLRLFDLRESAAVRNRFGNRNLENPLGYTPFGYSNANEAEVEPMEGENEEVPQFVETVKTYNTSGGAIGKFKKEKKKKKHKNY